MIVLEIHLQTKKIGRIYSIFARSLVVSQTIQQQLIVFIYLHITSHPHLSRNLDFDSADIFIRSTSTIDGKIVITGAHTAVRGSRKNLRLWDS